VDERALRGLADRLVEVPGVVAVVLGGSRARGEHRPDSDYDLGLYYRGDLDVAALARLAGDIGAAPGLPDLPLEMTAPGGWGPWVDGGGWLRIDGVRVDWIYRNLDRVHAVWADCQLGRYEIGRQAGHPLGFYSHAYAGEVALCRVLADPFGELAALRAQTRHYPDPLAEALVTALWEAEFTTGIARYGARGSDPTYAGGCLFRVVGVLCHALHGHARRWLINEKGMAAATGRLPAAPPGFAARCAALIGALGSDAESIDRTVDAAEELVAEVRAATA
jgi:hypothetical protein